MRAARELLKGLEYEVLSGSVDINVNELVYNTAKVTKACLFVCIKGMAFDSHEAAAKAAESGAVVIVAERPVEVPEGITVVLVKDTRYALALISEAYFDYPAKKLKVIGITGTKGKTTTAFMVRSILEHAGISTGLIGTIETIIGDRHIPASNTTPESYAIQEDFAQMVEAGCKVVVMEVSSQGLKLHRTAGILFDLGIFTNLAPDHIGPGEHESFEEYLECKSRLFRQCKVGIVNIDDEYCMKVINGHTCQLETYGFSENADLRALDMKLITRPGCLGVSYQVSGLENFQVEIDLPGRFSVYNSLVAIAICRHFDISKEDMLKALKEAKTKGRIERVKVSDDFTLMIDYAHNAMSLESLLTTLKEYRPKRLVCLFGCGGNRSRLRRFEMGEVSGRLADLTVITSDNPRFEEPQAIIDDIKTGMEKTDGSYVEIIDRKEAIRYVIEHGCPGDVIVLAGKGHEDYQEIRGVKYPMDERVLIQEVLEELA
ncbi:MAG: UDP-N-acetylmuramoyl-L-alanyl-D-glutamate--2,6-diaminopimelate ligase [Lachnospiraceae bacterium]|jgi:UDP-N-acetylmuramoyl-L-alanyl-D-glutamate--2,6-diaminopimelate ligase|nr:UDP-N-acetylmuramoyl-L-alanyl-D-glutamate--2,6-diaminopimelate ligase [Lachnospiraceae bacterium]